MHKLTLMVLIGVLSMGVAAVAQHQHQHEPSKPVVRKDQVSPWPRTAHNHPVETARIIPDARVLDHNGQQLSFYSDLVKGRVVIINFIYTSCTAFCPMSGNNFSRLQALLGDRLGRDVHLISVSTDPVTDSPARLKAWGTRFKVRRGWTLVTGNKTEMSELLGVLTGDGPRTGYHVPSIAIINDVRGNKRQVYGLESPERLIMLTDELSRLPASQ